MAPAMWKAWREFSFEEKFFIRGKFFFIRGNFLKLKYWKKKKFCIIVRTDCRGKKEKIRIDEDRWEGTNEKDK